MRVQTIPMLFFNLIFDLSSSTNTLVRLSPWLTPTLESSSVFNGKLIFDLYQLFKTLSSKLISGLSPSSALLTDEFPSAVNSFSIKDDAIVAACDNQQIRHVVGMTLV